MRVEANEYREKEEEAKRQSFLGHLGRNSSYGSMGDEDADSKETVPIEKLGTKIVLTSKLNTNESKAKKRTIALKQQKVSPKAQSQPKISRDELRKEREEKLK